MKPTLAPITDGDIGEVAEFMHHNLSDLVPSVAWIRAMRTTWIDDAPNHGFLLRAEGRVVGAYLAFYSRREVGGQVRDICNLGAWCVLDEFRFSGLKLLKAVLAQPGWQFTDLSPSGNVVALNEKLGFTRLDTSTALVLNATGLPSLGRAQVTSDPDVLEAYLEGRDREVYLDHRETAAARHVLLRAGGEACYVIFRHDRRKGLPLFASLLHVSNPELLHRHFGGFTRFLFLRHGVVATLAELRIVGRRPPLSRLIAAPRPKMFRSDELRAQDVDYLYSELVCLPW